MPKANEELDKLTKKAGKYQSDNASDRADIEKQLVEARNAEGDNTKALGKLQSRLDRIDTKYNELQLDVTRQQSVVAQLLQDRENSLGLLARVSNQLAGKEVDISETVKTTDEKGKETSTVVVQKYKLQGVGAKFNSAEDAAKDGLALGFAVSKAMGDNWEHGAVLYKNTDGTFEYGKIQYGIPRLTKEYYLDPARKLNLIETGVPALQGIDFRDSRAVGMFHTHPIGEKLDFDFSPGDAGTYKGFIESAKRNQTDVKYSFLGGNDGSFHQYHLTGKGDEFESLKLQGKNYFGTR